MYNNNGTNLGEIMSDIMSQVSRTVYSIGWPKTKEVFTQLQRNESIAEIFSNTWTKKQDALHMPFLNEWRSWISPRFIFSDEVKHAYPTNGSSEAICQQLNYLNSQGKTLAIFDGEYEGYEMFAKNMGMPIKKFTRPNSLDNFSSLQNLDSNTDVFFISEPSSIDGNHWLFFNQFLSFCSKKDINVYLDTAYIGMSRQESLIDVSKQNCIAGIFFSLSKTFGVYYHRIGGVWLKNENPLLWPNLWFKNLYAISYGRELMKAMPIGYMDEKLNKITNEIRTELSLKHNINFMLSDVYLLSNVVAAPHQYEWHKNFIRSNKSSALLRVCISQMIEERLENEKD